MVIVGSLAVDNARTLGGHRASPNSGARSYLRPTAIRIRDYSVNFRLAMIRSKTALLSS